MIKIAIANMKGGVGKSTSTMMLADTLSLHHSQRVLVVDCDPQANSSQMLLSFPGLKDAKNAERTLTDWVMSFGGSAIDGVANQVQRDAQSTITSNISGLAELKPSRFGGPKSDGQISVWASTPSLRFAELAFDHLFFEAGDFESPRRAMANNIESALQSVEGAFDTVIFDCPPGFSTLAQSALIQSDIVLSPLNVDRVSMWSLKSFWDQGLDDTLGLSARKHRYAFLTMVQSGRGGVDEKLAVRRDLAAYAKDNRIDVEMPFTVQALRFVRRADVDSYRGFNSKYGRLRDHVKRLGNQIIDISTSISEEVVQ